MTCLYRKWKRYKTCFGNSCKTGARTNIRKEIFTIGFGTRIMGTEINEKKDVVQMRNTSLLLDLYRYIIISVIIIIFIIIIIIGEAGVIGCGCGGGGDVIL